MNTEMDEEAAALARERVVQKFFRLYRSMDGKATQSIISLYLEPIKDCAPSAAQQAYERFLNNEVPGVDGNWVPNVPIWVAQVKMLNSLLPRMEARGDGLISYKMGELPPPGAEPLGPIRLEVDGRVTDVSSWTLAEKEEALRTGTTPESRKQIGAEAMRRIELNPQRMP